MSNEVEFDFEKEQRPEYRRQGSKLSRLVVKLSGGRVDETQANYVLLGVAILAFIISLFFFFGIGTVGNPEDIKILPAV